MATRSKWLGGGTFGDAATHVLYTVPAGSTAIIKSVLVSVLAGAALVPAVTVFHGSAGGPLALLGVTPSPGSTGAIIFPTLFLWEVMEPGDTLEVIGDGSASYGVTASGAELQGVAP